MSLLSELTNQRRVFAECPNCGDDFRLAEAGLFDATKPLNRPAQLRLDGIRAAIEEGNAKLRSRIANAETRSRVGAEAINIGKVVEKIAPSLPGFPLDPRDCRPLFEPVDYVAFNGLAQTGAVDNLLFVDVKSGGARLSGHQSRVREALAHRRIGFSVVELGDGRGV